MLEYRGLKIMKQISHNICKSRIIGCCIGSGDHKLCIMKHFLPITFKQLKLALEIWSGLVMIKPTFCFNTGIILESI